MSRLWLVAIAVLFAAAGALGVLWLRPPPAPILPVAAAAIGTTIAVNPAASIARPPASPALARLTMPVHSADQLQTGPDGAIRIQLADATFFSLGANASARIDSFVFDPGQNASRMSLSFTRGAFRFVSGKAVHAYPGQPAIRTPVAVLGIRGTGVVGVIGREAEVLWARIDPGYAPDGGDVTNATLILLAEGAIEVDGSGAKILMDVPGQVLFFVRPGAQPLGLRQVDAGLAGEITGMASPPSLGPEPGGPPLAMPSPSPSPSPSPNLVPVAVPVPGPSASPKPSPSPTAKPSPTPTSRPTPRPTPTITPRPTPTPRFTPKPTPTPRITPRPTPTPRFTPRPTPSPRATPRPTPKPTARPTRTPARQ